MWRSAAEVQAGVGLISPLLFWLTAAALIVLTYLAARVGVAYGRLARYRLRARGYFAASIIGSAVFVGQIITFFFTVLLLNYLDLRGEVSGEIAVDFTIVFFGLAVGAAWPVAVLSRSARLLSFRPAQDGGLRRPLSYRQSALAIALWLMTGGFVALCVNVFFPHWPFFLVVIEIVVIIVSLMVAEAIHLMVPYRLGEPSQAESYPEDVELRDDNGFGLYLRPFSGEDRGRFRFPYRRSTEISDGPRYPNLVALDEYVVEALMATVGPCLALGNPRDYQPPVGATRIYLPDSGWQASFKRLAHDASVLLMTPSASRSLAWELRHIAEHQHQKKLVVFTDHALGKRRPGALDRLLTRIEGEAHVEDEQIVWNDFAGTLAELNLWIGPHPGPGTVIGFNENRRSVVLARDCRDPREVFPIIAAWVGHPPRDSRDRT